MPEGGREGRHMFVCLLHDALPLVASRTSCVNWTGRNDRHIMEMRLREYCVYIINNRVTFTTCSIVHPREIYVHSALHLIRRPRNLEKKNNPAFMSDKIRKLLSSS